MNILVKSVLKNVFRKPLRTIIVIFSIFVCSVAAMACFDMSKTLKSVFMNNVETSVDADFQIHALLGESKIPDGFPESRVLRLSQLYEARYLDIPGEYNYARKETMYVYGFDPEMAADMELIEPVEIGPMEVVLTEACADRYGYSEGDTITLHDQEKNPYEFTVVKIISINRNNFLIYWEAAIVNEESADLLATGSKFFTTLVVDVIDNDQLPEARELLKEQLEHGGATDFRVSEDTEELISTMTSIFRIVFVIAFLLVIFVTYSICERIVNERMSLIGTLRSLGMSSRGTAGILLLENVFYAVFGSVPAVFVYSLIRRPFMSLFVSGYDTDGSSRTPDIPLMSAVLIISVILGAVLLECLIPLRAVIKALRVSIRDIIFDTRDTEYKINKPVTIIGLVLLVITVVLFFFREDIGFATLCLISAVISLALLFPIVFRYISKALKKISDKADSASWSLALIEAGMRKSTVTSGILCTTAAAMCVIVFSIALSAISAFFDKTYSCDIVMSYPNNEAVSAFVERADGITDIEHLYKYSDKVLIGENEDPESLTTYGSPEGGIKYFEMFSGVPEHMEEGTVYITGSLKSKYGLNVGDKVTFTFYSEDVIPIAKEFTVGGIFKMTSVLASNNTIILPLEDYFKIYHDKPSTLLMTSDDPEATAEFINTYTPENDVAKTRRQLENDAREESSGTIAVFSIIIIIAVGMTGIGIVSNQIIGFDGRKKELAVLLSTAMSRRKLTGVLVCEALVMSGLASGLGILVGRLLLTVLQASVGKMEEIEIGFSVAPSLLLICWAVVTLVFTLTVIFPVMKMKKMKIAEQIKYE